MNVRKVSWVATGLASVCAIGLAGCGDDGESSTASGASNSSTEGKELVVSSFGGDYEKAQQKALFSKFEEKYGVKVKLVTMYSADALAKLTAARGNSGIDVVQFSGGQEVQAGADGLLEKVSPDELSNSGAVFPQAEHEGFAPAHGFDAGGLIYRTSLKTPPTTWSSLADPQYKGRVAIPDIGTTYAIHILMGLGGGGLDNIENGFGPLEDVVANSHSVYKDAPTMVQLFSREEIDIGVYDGIYAFLMRKQGLPVGFKIPEDGGYLSRLTMNVVEGSENRDLALKLIDMSLDPAVQAEFASEAGVVPTNQEAKVDGDAAEVMPTAEEISGLEALDDAFVSKNRPRWTSQWNRVIAK